MRDQLVRDYESFTSSFVEARDERIKQLLEERSAEERQWPQPWLSLNPNSAPGGSVDELVDAGLLHPTSAKVFRVKDAPTDAGLGSPIRFHRHRREAIEAARTGASYVLTTGTGSGKSLASIAPIVDGVIRSKAEGDTDRRVRAIIVYPMNALANSQMNELRKFLQFGFAEGAEPVTFARYTGQETPDERQAILAHPPDIILTNYVMLDLVLTRPDERQHLIRAAEGLDFLVLDELHTYRGRQGSDVAMLIRRVRSACRSPRLQVVGTSATMTTEGSVANQAVVVADVASRLFGSSVDPANVIGETLVRTTAERSATVDPLRDAIDARNTILVLSSLRLVERAAASRAFGHANRRCHVQPQRHSTRRQARDGHTPSAVKPRLVHISVSADASVSVRTVGPAWPADVLSAVVAGADSLGGLRNDDSGCMLHAFGTDRHEAR